jgi:antitoxin HicB
MDNRLLTYSLKLEAHEDGHLAYFPALRGCHTWGRTYEEAVKHAEEALLGYLETLRMNGDELPEDHPAEGVALGLTVRMSTFV